MKALDKGDVLSRSDVVKIIWVPFHLRPSPLCHSFAPASFGKRGLREYMVVCIGLHCLILKTKSLGKRVFLVAFM